MITPREKSVEADVVGPAYSFNAPLTAEPELVETFQQGWAAAANAWTQSVQTALRAPLNFSSLMWGRVSSDATLKPRSEWAPDFSIVRRDHAIVVSAMLPGATQSDVDVEILDGKLVISGRCNFSPNDGFPDTFSESIDLMNTVDSQSVEARIDDEGFLEITLTLHADAPAH